jgi:hypothetical protein
MEYNGTAGSLVELADAAKWTKAFRDQMTSGGIKGYAYSAEIINEILNQDGCVGIRFYNGTDNGTNNLILVGFDEQGNDLFDKNIAQHGLPCPSNCGEANPLNHTPTT